MRFLDDIPLEPSHSYVRSLFSVSRRFCSIFDLQSLPSSSPFPPSSWHLVTVCSVAVISWGHTKSNERLGCNLLPSQISLKRERDGERENKDMIGICREAWETKQECLLLVNLISVSLSHLCCLLSQVLCRPHKWCKRHMDYLLWPRKLSGDLTRHQ